MPQLDSSTFASQIFWLCISFFSLLLISKWYIVPKIDEILSSRERHISSILDQASEFAKEAEKIDNEVAAELESARLMIESDEKNAIANIKANFATQMQAMHDRNLQKIAKAIDDANKHVDSISRDIMSEMPKLIESAYCKLYSR